VSYAIDSNILARSIENSHSMQQPALEAIELLLNNGIALFVLAQNLYEFWVIATRPTNKNGLGLSAADAESHLSRFETLFSVKVDTPAIYSEWRQLVCQHSVMGKPAHDARIAAAMVVHGISHLLTFNKPDFKRFQGITAVTPGEIFNVLSNP